LISGGRELKRLLETGHDLPEIDPASIASAEVQKAMHG
jgi:hypothetical protein